MSGIDLLSAFAVVVIWGLNFIAMKFALLVFTPFQLGAARFTIAALPLVFFIRRPQLPWRWIVLYGLCTGVGQFGFLFTALKAGMTAGLASVLMQTQVFFTALLGLFFLHEKPGLPLRFGMGLAALAIACFGMNFLTAAGAGHAVTVLGFALNLGAAAMWAVSNVVVRKLHKTGLHYDATALVVWSSLAPVLPFIALSLLLDPAASHLQWLQAGWLEWGSVAYLGLVATVAGYALWTGLLKRHPANKVAPFSLGVPVVGITAGMVILHETITAWQWAGIALVAAALACVMLGGRLASARSTGNT